MIAAVGVASQALSALMSVLAPSSGSSSTQSATASGFAQAIPCASRAPSPPPTQTLSGDMLAALMQLQTQSSGATSSSTSASNTVQRLFSAMDSNGDGEVSQSEMESYIEKSGGTQAQAGSLFNALGQTSAGTTSGISEQQMQSAVSAAQQAHDGRHRHHHHMQSPSGQADQISNTLLQAMDSDDDGSVSQDEFTGFVTANGGTAADATSDFAALNTSGSGSLPSADFAKAFQSYRSQQSQQSGGAALVSFLDTLANANASSASVTSISA